MIKGYNAYLDGVKVNGTLLLTPSFEFTGLASDTDYSDRIAMTAVDFAGNESVMSSALPTGTAKTPTLPEGPVALSAEDQAMVDSIVTASMAESGQPGVLVAITGPRGSYTRAYGNTTASGGRPLTLDDHVRIGSTTKSFVAMAVLKAIDDGVLSFDDTLGSFAHPTIDITKVPNSEKITVRQLLSMRSGVFDYQQDTLIQIVFTLNPTATFSPAGAVQSIVQHNASMFEPDTSYQYTNSNFVLLGLILEVVRGKSIKRILAEDIIAPVGLTETQWPSNSFVPTPAAGSAAFNPELFGAAGALTSTIGDLSRWAQSLRDHDLISADMWDIWTSWFWDYDTGWSNLRYKAEYIPLRYSYGLGAENIGTWYGHPGGIPGWGASVFFDKASGATIVVSENKATTSPVLAAQTRIFTRIANYLYPDSMFDGSHPPVPAPAADLGLDVVSAPISGFQSASGPFAAAAGADVFVVVAWDRPAVPTVVSYGGALMELLGSAYHDNNSANGGLSVYRRSGAGTGAEKTIAVSGSGGWISAYGISFNEVTSIGSPVFLTGQGTALSQAVTNSSGTTLQVFSAGAAGGPTYALGPLSGGRNRAKQFGTNPLLWVNTTTKTGSVAATASGTNKWAACSLHIGVVEQQIVKPSGASITTTRGTPGVVQDVANRVLTPGPRTISITGGRPGGSAFTPSGANLSVTGGTPSVDVVALFTPFSEENVTRTDYPVPTGASGAWVTLGGAGGGGGGGKKTGTGNRGGGGGGGGGALVKRVWIPITELGPTYSVTRGLGGSPGTSSGTNGATGGYSRFVSGDVSLTANGGSGGLFGSVSTGGNAGAGGTASVTGVTADTYTGANGGHGGSSTSSAGSSLEGAGAGGGGGSGATSSGSINGGTSANGTSPGPGGNGGHGGHAVSGTDGTGWPGANGYTLVEWE